MLLVMRHGKSDWSAGTGDHGRPLNSRGVKSAERMGRVLTELGLSPDLVISSTATRALSTARLALESGRWECELRTTDDFYEADVASVLAVLRGLDPSVNRCMVVGHNPTWTALVHELTGANVAMKTATVAAIETSRWDLLGDVRYGSNELVTVLQPRHFM
jgi:phosphohistidine phosphatase